MSDIIKHIFLSIQSMKCINTPYHNKYSIAEHIRRKHKNDAIKAYYHNYFEY